MIVIGSTTCSTSSTATGRVTTLFKKSCAEWYISATVLVLDHRDRRELVDLTRFTCYLKREKGHEVRGMLRSSGDLLTQMPEAISPNPALFEPLVIQDLRAPDCLDNAVQDCDYVIHAAGPFSRYGSKHIWLGFYISLYLGISVSLENMPIHMYHKL